jgi:hypothetical protein
LDEITEDSAPEPYSKIDIELAVIGEWDSFVLSEYTNSFVLLTCRLIEKNLNSICQKVRERKKIKISWKQIRGSVTKKAKTYLEVFGGLNINTDIYNRVCELQELRNSIIHGSDFDFETSDGYQMKATNKKERKLKSLSARNCGVVDQFGNLSLKIEFCDYCVETISNFFNLLKIEHSENFQIRSVN